LHQDALAFGEIEVSADNRDVKVSPYLLFVGWPELFPMNLQRESRDSDWSTAEFRRDCLDQSRCRKFLVPMELVGLSGDRIYDSINTLCQLLEK
jgi:hypothetical protein